MKLIGEVEINDVEKIASGKVREMFSFNNELLIVTTDRISAFDYILDSLIPVKGIVLNKISNFWFKYLKYIQLVMIFIFVGLRKLTFEMTKMNEFA